MKPESLFPGQFVLLFFFSSSTKWTVPFFFLKEMFSFLLFARLVDNEPPGLRLFLLCMIFLRRSLLRRADGFLFRVPVFFTFSPSIAHCSFRGTVVTLPAERRRVISAPSYFPTGAFSHEFHPRTTVPPPGVIECSLPPQKRDPFL